MNETTLALWLSIAAFLIAIAAYLKMPHKKKMAIIAFDPEKQRGGSK